MKIISFKSMNMFASIFGLLSCVVMYKTSTNYDEGHEKVYTLHLIVAAEVRI